MCCLFFLCFFFFKQKTAYEMRISDWSSDVCSSDLHAMALDERRRMFRLAEWEQPQPFVPVRFRPKEWEPQDIEQRWFSGVHSDIGGGYPEKESGLSKIPLIWMIDEAEKAGLRVTERNLAKFPHGAPPAKNENTYTHIGRAPGRERVCQDGYIWVW